MGSLLYAVELKFDVWLEEVEEKHIGEVWERKVCRN